MCQFFNRSGYKIKIFQNFQKEKLDRAKVTFPPDIRWISKFNAVKRVLLLYPAIVHTFAIL